MSSAEEDRYSSAIFQVPHWNSCADFRQIQSKQQAQNISSDFHSKPSIRSCNWHDESPLVYLFGGELRAANYFGI